MNWSFREFFITNEKLESETIWKAIFIGKFQITNF